MANTFGILAALILAFSAFVAHKNKEEFEKQKLATEAESARKDRNQKTFEGLITDIDGLTQEKIDANKERDDFQVKLDEQIKVNETILADSKSKQSELDSVTASLKEKKDTLVELGEIKELAPKIERLKSSITELEDQVAILTAGNSRLNGEKTSTANSSNSASEELSRINSGKSDPAMKTKIRSYDPSLGIVTLSGGMSVGVIGGSKVKVMREGEKIADMNVTAVSANSATADIIRATLAEGENVSVGDTVVPAE